MKRVLSIFLLVTMLLSAFGFSTVTATVTEETPKLIAFTFDDGPGFYTDELLDGLAQHGAKATFFVNGKNGSALGAAFHTDLLERMVTEGHQLANHTDRHRVPFDGLTAEEVKAEVEAVNTYIYNAMGGHYQTLVRTPGGATSDTIRENVSAPIILWSLDTLDWKYRNETTVYDNIMAKAKDGAIVLLHDIYSSSVNGALKAIGELRQQGYECVTVSELFRRRGQTLQNGTVYNGGPAGGTPLDPYAAPTLSDSFNAANGNAIVKASSPYDGMTYYYTTDGTTPTMRSERYTGAIDAPYGSTVTVVGYDTFGTRTPAAKKTLNQSYESVFDAAYYAEKYPELKRVLGDNTNALLGHFLTFGIAEGRQASPIFSVKYYMAHQTALQQTLGNAPAKYMEHFMTVGMQTGARGSAEFDPASYRLTYPDLRKAYGDSWGQYYMHYVRQGRAEGRLATGRRVMRGATTVYNGVDYAAVYNYTYYTTLYPDIGQAYRYNDYAALEHFVEYGMKEGRVACKDFDVTAYKDRYVDLRRDFGNNTKAYYYHYLRRGMAQHRKGN